MSESSDSNECAVCLEPCIHAVRLHCNHVFCYLCVKGAAHQSNRCPVCRQPIAHNYFENPNLIDGLDLKDLPQLENEMQWLYEGHNGWWVYDARTGGDIEDAFQSKKCKQIELLIAGFVYVIDFDRMIQFRRNEPNRIRKIKRQPIDPTITKGIAGLRTNLNDVIPQHTQQSLVSNNNETQSSEENTQIVDENGDQIPIHSTGRHNSENETQESNNSESEENVVQLEQLFTTSLNLRDTRETYL